MAMSPLQEGTAAKRQGVAHDDGVIRMIQAHSLTKIYKTPATQVVVFEDLNIAVERGKLVSIVGPSGAGKSTLLHLFGGLDTPTRGAVLYGGKDIFRWTAN